jgi:hypothetical protein
MSSRYQYTSVDRILAKLDRDVTRDYNEGDVIEWIGEALEATHSVKSYEEAVIFIEVKNHQCKLPKGLHAIIQIARYNNYSGPQSTAICAQEVLSECNPNFDFGVFRIDTTSISLVPSFDFKINYSSFVGCGCYKQKFSPVRLTNNSFFNTLVCYDGATPYTGNSDEYNVIMGDTLRFSFEEGCIALAYLAQAVDEETGYPLVPDTYSHTTAITWYVRLMMLGRREFGSQAWNTADRQWQWYCKQASNIDIIPHGIDEHQNLLAQRSYLLPRQFNYYSYFGNLGKEESRKFNNPRRIY